MNGANEMRALIVVGELEIALGVGLGARGFFHAVAQLDEDDFVAGRGLVGGLVGDRAGQVLGGSERGEEQYEEECYGFAGEIQTLAPFLSWSEDAETAWPCSRRAISARMAAASSSSEVFI